MSPHNNAAIPLLSLDAVAFDSETTGLDTTKARIIQLGAVRITGGAVDESQSFQRLINPGVPIAPDSRAIHGISDEDIAGADTFREVKPAFDAWRREAVLIGYASGFDLAMLKREQEIAGLEWVAPRCLDVRYLATIVAPTLPDFSLDTLAAWLDIEIRQRHSALGDAVATARIFIALIPQLRQYGIRTLAEAERACQRSSEAAFTEFRRGWEDVHPPKLDKGGDKSGDKGGDKSARARIDCFPYQHRLRELMSAPPLLVDGGMRVRDALALLIDSEVSSLYIRADDRRREVGIVTERDLLREIRRNGAHAFERQVGDLAQYPLISLSADAFVYRAVARMKRLHVRHLGVHDEQGKIIGALSARDLLRQRDDDAILLGDDIDAAQSSAEMAAVWGNIALVAKGLVAEGVDARDVAAVISRELCALTRQACKLAELEMPPAPCAYAMLVLGSGGRGESLLAMDQDNAIVYAAGAAGGPEDAWFTELGVRVADMLDAAGVPYCKGGVMASHDAWRKSVTDWRLAIHTWVKRQSPGDILNCDIFFDAVCVHGDIALAERVIGYAFTLGAQSTAFIQLMSVNACKNAPPLGWFGRFKLEQGRMDLKAGGILPIFSTARLIAIKNRVRARGTAARLEAVRTRQKEFRSMSEDINEAHRIIIDGILQQQLLDLENGIPLSTRVAPGQLSSAMRERLGWALRQVPNVSNLLGDPLSVL